MTKPRFSHAQCEHPSTKAAREKCRKAMRAAALGETASKAAPETKSVETPADGIATDDTVETAPSHAVGVATAEPVEITTDTWRDHKSTPVLVYVKGVEEPFPGQELTGWSIKFLQFTDVEGKRQRIPASTVERVTV